ncbi:hypothetical protein [Desulfovibrio inopinatus]|uniref:PDC sensor domain-containing protein n=1 Tax=Desulfovibrio inopinatus TaxID=102109 RepID=UPI00040DCD7C|nr:hypothetical protein [Desulfovibrio inopinatus]
MKLRCLWCSMCLMVLSLVCTGPVTAADEGKSQEALALVRIVSLQTADNIELGLGLCERSVEALGQEFVKLRAETPVPDAGKKVLWKKRFEQQDDVTLFALPGQKFGPMAFQAPAPSLLAYTNGVFSDDVFRDLETFVHIWPSFQAAYKTFGYSWVYLTTVNEAFLIYPRLPLKDAVANSKPTEKHFYTVADFANRKPRWERPYLDLAGAGMMVTVSAPMFDGDATLGVVSRDVTLDQISRKVLAASTMLDGLTSVLVLPDGLAVAASDTALQKEIDTVNSKAKAAVLYYRDAAGIATVSDMHGIASKDALANAVVEEALKRVLDAGDADVLGFTHRGPSGSAAVAVSGSVSPPWFVVSFKPISE